MLCQDLYQWSSDSSSNKQEEKEASLHSLHWKQNKHPKTQVSKRRRKITQLYPSADKTPLNVLYDFNHLFNKRFHLCIVVVVVHSLTHVQLFAIPWPAACQASLSFTISLSLLKLMSIESVMPSKHLIFCHALLLPPLIISSMRVFSNESALHIRWLKYQSFCFSISPSNEYSGLISFRTDWLDFLEVQGTLKSLPQHHSSKASILQCSGLFMVQL